MSKVLNFVLEEEYIERMDKIAKKQYTDRTKLLRKWIDVNFKEEYGDFIEPE